MNTCAGYDSSAPQDVLKAIKAHLKKQGTGRKHLDQKGCCMLQDTGGKGACTDLECKYDGNPKVDYPDRPKDPL
jgi:hypothetical protein